MSRSNGKDFSKSEKMEQSDIDQMKKMFQDLYAIERKIGQMEIAKISAIAAADDKRSQLSRFQNKLQKKYGKSAMVNMDTGDISRDSSKEQASGQEDS